MKKLIGVFLLVFPVLVVASNCDKISANIAEKIKNNGVDPSQFQLKLESADKSAQQAKGKIVGSCDRGHQNIIYVRSDRLINKQPNQPTNVTDVNAQNSVDEVQSSTINPAQSNQFDDFSVPDDPND
ncbi:DUF1161 domain-containing protein [Gilliamella mensalis]|uniref:DUF1161 domain-containing protein n=1 Tax=Gilliamella mensalis TaxID=1908520 RepID=UPI000A1641F8|nr:DUF1161 domain-containing protein [Gilliamella mensalis]